MRTPPTAVLLISLMLLLGCSTHRPGNDGTPPAAAQPAPALLMIVRLKVGLSDDEMDKMLRERAPLFRAVPGLLQKYYVRERETGAYSGVYLWDSEASLARFRESDLAKSIPTAYRVSEPPKIEIHRVLFPLRD